MAETLILIALIVITISSACCAIFLAGLGYGMSHTHQVIVDASDKLDKIIERLDKR